MGSARRLPLAGERLLEPAGRAEEPSRSLLGASSRRGCSPGRTARRSSSSASPRGRRACRCSCSASLAGYAFARLNWRGRDFWFVCMLATMMLPGQVLLIPHYLIFKNLGWVNTYKPLIVPAWLGGGAFSSRLMKVAQRAIISDGI